MFDVVLKTLLIWALAGGLLIITLVYVISNTLMTGIDAPTRANSLD